MANFTAFIGGSYESQSPWADCSVTMNMYPEQLQDEGATAKRVLYPTPGVEVLDSVEVGNGRAHLYINGREFAVIGAKFYEADVNGTLTDRGDVLLDGNPATISSNGDGGNQLFITSGGNGYCYELGTNVLTQVASMDGKCTMGDMLDGRFLVLNAPESKLHWSEVFNGQVWATDFAQRSLAPDRWLSMRVVGRLIWLFGEITSEPWHDAGGTIVPYAPAPSGLITYGIAAPFSATIIGNDVIWLAATKSGQVCVVKATGYSPEVLSNYPLESAIGKYRGVSMAVGDAYSDEGHTFYLLSFDQADKTHGWDTETRLWHHRGTWLSDQDRFVVWRPRFFVKAFGQLRALDMSGGSLYRVGSDLVRDVDGLDIRRMRRAPAILDENNRVFFSEFELDLETGLASIDPTTVDFSMTDVTGLPRWVQFNDASSSDVSSWLWLFGDGTSSTAQNPSHIYAAGVYTVTLFGTGANGTAQHSETVTVTASAVPTWTDSSVVSSQSVPSSDPQVMLRMSNDGGKTWIAELWRSAGKLGEYHRRVRWNGLGSARRRVFEINLVDAIPWRIVGCFLKASSEIGGGR